jgi:hypothetical protein
MAPKDRSTPYASIGTLATISNLSKRYCSGALIKTNRSIATARGIKIGFRKTNVRYPTSVIMDKFAAVALFDLRTGETRLSIRVGGWISNQEFPRKLL